MDDPFLFGPASVTWQLHSDPAVIVGGLRALLYQAVHPLAMAGVDQHSTYRQDPWGRLERTSNFVLGATYGTVSEAGALAEGVKRVHRRVTGVDPVTGRSYRAEDPELLAWIHNVMVDSFIQAKRRYGSGLTTADAEQYLSEMVRMATLLGTPPSLVPTTLSGLEAYLASVPDLMVSDTAREALLRVLFPPMPMRRRPLWSLLTTAAVGLLPGRVRSLYGLVWLPPMEPALRATLRVAFAAFGLAGDGPPQRKRAERRLSLGPGAPPGAGRAAAA